MGSLPSLFRQTEDDFKKTKKGYLKSDPERVSAIRDRLGLEGKKSLAYPGRVSMDQIWKIKICP